MGGGSRAHPSRSKDSWVSPTPRSLRQGTQIPQVHPGYGSTSYPIPDSHSHPLPVLPVQTSARMVLRLGELHELLQGVPGKEESQQSQDRDPKRNAGPVTPVRAAWWGTPTLTWDMILLQIHVKNQECGFLIWHQGAFPSNPACPRSHGAAPSFIFIHQCLLHSPVIK